MRTNDDLQNTYSRPTTETITHLIAQNIPLIYPHFKTAIVQRRWVQSSLTNADHPTPDIYSLEGMSGFEYFCYSRSLPSSFGVDVIAILITVVAIAMVSPIRSFSLPLASPTTSVTTATAAGKFLDLPTITGQVRSRIPNTARAAAEAVDADTAVPSSAITTTCKINESPASSKNFDTDPLKLRFFFCHR